ncbi:MAG: helix-turn-helix domain-containing protein [Solirubrobacteraceae bacterium]
MSDRTIIGKCIKHEREAAGYTQVQLAEIVGIDDTVLSKIESGQRGIDSLILRRIARALDVPMDRFFEAAEPLALAREADSEQLRGMADWARKMKADLAFVREQAARRYG